MILFEWRRDNINILVQRCSNSKYAASEIGEAPFSLNIVKNVMASAGWVQPASIPTPGLALNFPRLALLEFEFACPDAAGEAALSAAWVANDRKQTAHAIDYRSVATRHITLALAQMEQDGDRREVLQARLVDVLRRSRRWLDANALCRHAQVSEGGDIIATILRFQRTLIKKRIVGSRTVEDAHRADTSAPILAWGARWPRQRRGCVGRILMLTLLTLAIAAAILDGQQPEELGCTCCGRGFIWRRGAA